MPDHWKDALMFMAIMALFATWVGVSLNDKLWPSSGVTVEKRCEEKLSGCD